MKFAKQFAEGEIPNPEELTGDYKVRLLVPFLRFRILGHAKVFPGGETPGYNRFLGFIRIARFRLSRGRSLYRPDEEALLIIYDDPANAFFIRPLVDEVRRTPDGNYIGRGIYRVFGRMRNIFYFTIGRD